MKILILAAAIAGIALGALPAAAQPVGVREHRQQRRIDQGVRSGELTHREAYRLERQQARIDRSVARDRRTGGHLSYAERRRLAYRQDRASRAIYRQKHDRQMRR